MYRYPFVYLYTYEVFKAAPFRELREGLKASSRYDATTGLAQVCTLASCKSTVLIDQTRQLTSYMRHQTGHK